MNDGIMAEAQEIAEPAPRYMSVSRLNTYLECSMKYKLHYVDHAPELQAPWFWQGTAVHAVMETFWCGVDDEETLYATYSEAWMTEENEAREIEPDPDKWITGTVTRKGAKDAAQRFHKGFQQYHDWIDWTRESGLNILEDEDGVPAVEVPFELPLGNVVVRGRIDEVLVDWDGTMIVQDPKTGTKQPETAVQLEVYRLAAMMVYSRECYTGQFWMAKDKGPKVHQLGIKYSPELLTEMFENARRGIEAEVFIPRESGACWTCTQRPNCPIWKGVE